MKTTGSSTSNSTPQGVSNRVAAEAHKAVERVAEVADEATLRTRSGIDTFTERAHSAVDRAAGAVAPTASWLNEQARNIKANQQQLVDDARRAIIDHPFAAVGIAAATGYLISRILRR